MSTFLPVCHGLGHPSAMKISFCDLCVKSTISLIDAEPEIRIYRVLADFYLSSVKSFTLIMLCPSVSHQKQDTMEQ